MGKRQHQSDKMYITGKEWSAFYGGHKKKLKNADFRRLPFFCCSISMQPVENPMCSKEGHVFDLLNIVPWLKKFGTNPITGKKLDAKSLFKVTFHKNKEDKYHCPVLFKTFNENSHIVAIMKTGNVFSYEAVNQLNIKAKNFKDLLTDEKFTREDIVTIQDPTNLDKFNFQNFFHLKHNQKLPDDDLKARSDPRYYMKSTNAETSQTLSELYKDYKGDKILAGVGEKKSEKKLIDKYNATSLSSGKVAASFTSTARTPEVEHEMLAKDDDVVRYSMVKQKGYIRLSTNKGNLNLELHCDITPKTCENFIGLCKKNYYDNTIFHRSIKNFMIQGGDPSGKGTEGDSLWGGPFKDEFRPNLSHSERGILSMANSGPGTNKSQFFITFRSCKHLDKKHTVFGKVVGGLSTLSKLEEVETDRKNDAPLEKLKILAATVFVDPFEEADAKLVAMRKKDAEDKLKQESDELQRKEEALKAAKPKVYRSGIGKYINTAKTTTTSVPDQQGVREAKKKRKLKSSKQLDDFSAW